MVEVTELMEVEATFHASTSSAEDGELVEIAYKRVEDYGKQKSPRRGKDRDEKHPLFIRLPAHMKEPVGDQSGDQSDTQL